MNKSNYQKWSSQLRKGYLELCVLACLKHQKSAYGLEILQLFTASGLDVNEGTLYPLLNRMEQNGWLVSDWKTPKSSGHPRRFYKLSTEGRKNLDPMQKEFENNYQIFNLIRKPQ